MPSPYSYSSLSMFDNCPQAYAHRYIWKTVLPEEELSLNLPMSTGSIVHSVLEWAHTQAMGKHDVTLESALEQLPALWQNTLNEAPQPIPEEELAPFLERSKENVSWYFDTLFNTEKTATIGVEKKMMFPLNYKAKQWVLGFIDRISQPEENVIILHDYKTGSTAMSANALKKDFQANLYGNMAIREYEPLKKVELHWHFLSKQKTVKIDLDPDHAREAVSKAQRIANGIESHKQVGLFPTKPGWACSWCDYKPVCPAHKEKK